MQTEGHMFFLNPMDHFCVIKTWVDGLKLIMVMALDAKKHNSSNWV